jgi:hypothetical protein
MKREYRLLALTFFAIVSCCIATTAPSSSAQNPQGAELREKPAEQVYRNVQVFKGLPASQLYPAMNFISGALGVACAHCHVPNQFEKDDKAAKQTARRMIEMTQTLNRGSFGEAQAVTCYTCHRGQAQYTRMTVTGRARIGEHEVWRERLYFDTRTGLLVRRQIEAKTALGRMPFAADFDDYREVDGLKWPFTVRQLFPNLSLTQRFTEVRLNVGFEDERFKRPTTTP